ncbi:hypothetical protein Voc01_009360 [Virgisporangium ochraceum]|uniref:Uncharacterized protein n=1 Tax=Virgisporangium ochraceum TaxID=65505 RepID=A0A8J3ZKJ3_9ACTN|nr:hypothetical protein Voc01_009360 [Virgisporangium ochraceum]
MVEQVPRDGLATGPRERPERRRQVSAVRTLRAFPQADRVVGLVKNNFRDRGSTANDGVLLYESGHAYQLNTAPTTDPSGTMLSW